MMILRLLMTTAVCLLPLAEANVFFTEQPANEKAVEGLPISLSCSVNTSSGTFSHWVFKPAGQDSYSALESETSTTLQKASFTPNDAGDYRCKMSVQEPNGIALSQPATVSYFNGSIVEHPKAFNSYVLIDDPSNFMMRPVIAFECKFDPESSIRPQITWQECHADGSYTDILETTEPVNDGPQRDIFKHYFFQSGYTGYFQILDHNNESAYDGTRYRCKASSTLPDDSAAVFSDCATVTFHSANVSIPEDLPTFRTIPQETVVLTEENSVGALACSIQRNDNNTDLVVKQNGNLVISARGLFALGLPLFGYTYIPQANLQIDLADLDNPSDFTSETYVCSLDGEETGHSTTFIREDPIVFSHTEEVVQDVIVVGEEGAITFSTAVGSDEQRVLKDGMQLALDGSDVPEVQYSMNMESGVTTHTLTIPTVTEEHEGIYQFEVENKTGRVIEYHRVAAKIKARSTSAPSQVLVAKVTQDLGLTCSAMGNVDDSQIDFTWERDGATLETSSEPPSDGVASHTYTLGDVRETNSGDYVCSPTNSYGGSNSSRFTVQVEKYDPPTGVVVDNEEGNEFAIVVKWNPIDVMASRYPGAHVDKYRVVLTVITATGESEMEQDVPGSETNASFSISSAAFSYNTRVKAVTEEGDDITNFSAEASAVVSTTVAPVAQGLQGWAIFLIIFFILLLVLGGLLILCLLFFLLARIKYKGQYKAEEKEKKARESAKEADSSSETSV